MIETPPIHTMTDTELEAWFAGAGLTATVVDRCPDPTCHLCRRESLAEAA